jgi:hypothetical protein
VLATLESLQDDRPFLKTSAEYKSFLIGKVFSE